MDKVDRDKLDKEKVEKTATALPSPKRLVYYHIAAQGIASKADLLAEFRLTSSTLTRVLEELTEQGLICEAGHGPSSGGRRPILYAVNPDYGYFFGIEISRFYSTLGLFDAQMNLMSSMRWRMDEAMTPDQLLQLLHSTIRAILRDHQLEQTQVRGIGIGAVGPLDRERGIILNPLHFAAPGWRNLPICSLLEARTGLPVMLENGANAALMGEHWALQEARTPHMLYIHAGVGLRSAMLSGGQIVHGTVDMEGSIGQMIIQTDGPRLHESGNYGALEAFVSVQAIEQRARARAKLGQSELSKLFQVSAEQLHYDLLLKALGNGHPEARELFMEAAAYLGIGLANAINLFHPEQIVLGGALVNAHEDFFHKAVEVATRNTYYYPEYQPQFSKGQLREDAVATGAALMVWRQLHI